VYAVVARTLYIQHGAKNSICASKALLSAFVRERKLALFIFLCTLPSSMNVSCFKVSKTRNACTPGLQSLARARDTVPDVRRVRDSSHSSAILSVVEDEHMQSLRHDSLGFVLQSHILPLAQ
jgi:hypothetical protein